MKGLNIHWLCLLTALTLGVAAACSGAPGVPSATPTVAAIPVAPMDAQRTLQVGEMERTYFLHVPDGLNDQQPAAIVFVFHGFQENGAYARSYTGLDEIANANGFVVVYPDGSGLPGSLSWNGGGCCGYALLHQVDEAAFVRSILEDVKSVVRVDPKRIFAVGFSNGALLSYRLACEMSDTFAAIAPAGGVLMVAPCEPQQNVSLIHIHGMKDQVVPFEGGGGGPVFPPVRESLATWAKLDGCSGAEQVQHEGLVTHTVYGTCRPGVSVELYALDGMGHSWPSKYVVPISQTVWDFFKAHPKP